MRHYRKRSAAARGDSHESGADNGRVDQVEVAVALLRRRGERITKPRQAVLEVLDGTREHLTADEIVSRAEDSSPGVHRATVYRALATLGELGLVTHTHLPGSATVYHLALPAAALERHAHLQCTSCQAVIDVPVEILSPLAEALDREVGFRLEPDHAALLGQCADCRPPH